MKSFSQPSPAGGVSVSWYDGETISGALSISNMLETQIAQAQGVKGSGHLVVELETAKKITLDTYLKAPKRGEYIHVIDNGIIESGEGYFQTRQFAVETVRNLPR